MEVILIRHLATPGNEKRQYIGRTDEPLSDRAVSAFRERQGGPAAEAVSADCGADLAGDAGADRLSAAGM